MSTRPILIYDGDCAFCTSSVNWLAARLRSTIEKQPYQLLDLAAYNTTEARAMREVLFVDRNGHVTGGAQAFGSWLRTAGKGWALLGQVLRVPPISWIGAVVYRLIANNRRLFAKLH